MRVLDGGQGDIASVTIRRFPEFHGSVGPALQKEYTDHGTNMPPGLAIYWLNPKS